MPERETTQLDLFSAANASIREAALPYQAEPDQAEPAPAEIAPPEAPPGEPAGGVPGAPPHSGAASSTELDNREERIARFRGPCLQCTACGLSQTRTRVVVGEGNLRSPLVIVGEGPGEQEDATGRPFVGRAGALLEAALKENGIGRQHVYITNVLKCRACSVEGRMVRNRPPLVEEVESCRPWLSEELGIVQPLVILCVGGPSASWIIHPEFRILKERGKWFTTPWARAAMATLHPAYVLRQQGAAYEQSRAALVQDIGEARRKVLELKRQDRENDRESR